MARLTFEKLRKAFKEVNSKGEMFKTDKGVTISFDYDERFTAVNTGFEDLNKYYNYNGSLLDIARKLKLNDLVSGHENNKIYTMYKTPEKTQEQIEKEEADFNELFGF